jgi:hypothetical protein
MLPPPPPPVPLSGVLNTPIGIYYPLLFTPNFTSVFDKGSPLYSTLFQMYPVYILTLTFLKVNFNIIINICNSVSYISV